jgi:hypothetical protein
MKNKPFAWEDFVNQLPNHSKQSDIIETAGKLVRIRVGNKDYKLYAIDEKSAEEFRKAALDESDNANIKTSLNNRLSTISSEIQTLDENAQKEVVTNIFASVAVEYAVNKTAKLRTSC